MTTSSSTTSSPPAPSPSGEPAALDLAGEVCPYTFVRTRLALESLPLGAELLVTVDHPPAARNVPRSAREWGQDVLAVDETAPGRWTIRLRKRVQ
jgi:tRNA 2-thiouridine synthesizing protein A